MGEKESDEVTDQSDAEFTFESEQDRNATEFLELEEELREIDGAGGDPFEAFTTGIVETAERVSAIPASYPDSTSSNEALALDVRLGSGHTTTVYTDWPGEASDESPVLRLLSSLDIALASFGDLYGQKIPLERVEDHYVLSMPPDSTLMFPWWIYGVIGGLVAQIPYFFFFQWDSLFGITMIMWLLVPVFTYFDVKYVKSHSTWDPHRFLWPILMLLWWVNIPVGLYYLYKRYQAEFRPR